MSDTPVEVQFTSAGCLNYPCRTPHQEHDFGSFNAEGETIFFKIDYFDKAMTYHSPDPADPSVTERVITIMLAQEY
jgi:Protein of unknown function (DUF3768)